MSVGQNKAKRLRLLSLITSLCSFALISAVSVYAQNSSSDSSKATISGTVINAITRAPIARALVSSPDSRYAMLTDSAGRFEFEMDGETPGPSIPAAGIGGNATYPSTVQTWLTARKPGYLSDGESGALAVSGQEATIALTPEALIAGRISFSTPETTSTVTVQLFSRQVQDGLPRWTQQASATTNAAGEFRFADLHAGSYRLSTTESLDNDPGAMISRSQVYGFPPVYYPNATDFSTAGTIEVSPGQTVQAGLALLRQPYYQVRIPVNGDMSGGINVVVSPQGHRGPGYSLGPNIAEHRIEGLLPNGTYVVDAISYGENSASGTANLRVAGGPAEGTTLSMVPNSGVVLNVKEEFSTQTQSATGDMTITAMGGPGGGTRSHPIRGPRAYLQATLESADDFGSGMQVTLRQPKGPNDDSLVLDNVPPGHYWLRLYPGMHGYAASAMMGAVDLLHQPLTVTTGSGGQIDITMRDDFASVEGTVSGPNTAASTSNPYSSTVWVYFVPLPDSSGQPTQTGVGPDGHFGTLEIVPGNYRVLAFPRVRQDLPYRDPQAMKAYETKGQVIHVAPGQKANLQLQLSSED